MNAISEEEVIQLWLDHCYADSTRRAYEAEWKRFQHWCQRHQLSCSLKKITPVAISSFLQTRNLGDSAKRRVIIIFRSLYSFAAKCGHSGISPAHLLRCPRPNVTIHERILSKENLMQMLQSATTKRDRMIVSFFVNSGARVNEVAKVKVGDLTYRNDGSTVVKLNGKGGKIRRVVLNLTFSKNLQSFVEGLSLNAPLFSGRHRGPLTPSGLRRVIKVLVHRANLNRRISPHFLRHYFANTALNNGARIHHVAHALGHSSLHSTTVYTHGTLLTVEAPSSFLEKPNKTVEERSLVPM